MLALSRKINESIVINDNIEVLVLDIKGDQVRLGIAAPKDVKIYRKEIYQAIRKENEAAAMSLPDLIPSLDILKKKVES